MRYETCHDGGQPTKGPEAVPHRETRVDPIGGNETLAIDGVTQAMSLQTRPGCTPEAPDQTHPVVD